MARPKKNSEDKVPIASNRRARHQYEIIEVFEAGLSLLGPEVKSLRDRNLNFEGAFARIDKDEVFLHNLYIAPYQNNTTEDLSPTRTRKLLLRRREIRKLDARVGSGGLTLVPLEIYFRRGWAKIALALAKGRRGPDKRRALKAKQAARELSKSFKGKFKV